jgi:hypothetical protein
MGMSTLNVTTIQSNTASTPPVINDSAGTQIGTFCRAWVQFNGTGTVAIQAAFNVSSVTDSAVGSYTVNLTTSMADGAGCVVGAARNFGVAGSYCSAGTQAAGAAFINTYSIPSTLADVNYVAVALFR